MDKSCGCEVEWLRKELLSCCVSCWKDCCCVLLRQRIEWGWLRSGRHTKSDRSNVRCTFFARQKRKTGGGPSLFSRIRQITTTIIYISAHIPCVSRVEFTMYHLGSAHEIITAVQSPESPAVGNQKKQRADRELCLSLIHI